MRNRIPDIAIASLLIAAGVILAGCGGGARAENPAAEAPPPVKVVPDVDVTLFKVDHPEQFPLATSTSHTAAPELTVTGTVTPDVARNIPVVSLVTGRVVAIHARLGDTVTQGQVLLTVRSDDVAGGYSDYHKALEDELLANKQLKRAQDLFAHGAIAQADLESAENASNKAKVDVETFTQHLRLLGNDPATPNLNVDILAPASGIITDQQITNAGGIQSLGANPFTISDLSTVWIVCDVYENDLPRVKLGDVADIRLNAYPTQVFKGTISNIGPVMDPNIRTAKVRLEVRNPGNMRLGMFVTATFRGQTVETRTVVPSTAILHIHDRDYVYVPAENNQFRRLEVVSGDGLPGNMQEIVSGIKPGQQVVSNALIIEHTIDQ